MKHVCYCGSWRYLCDRKRDPNGHYTLLWPRDKAHGNLSEATLLKDKIDTLAYLREIDDPCPGCVAELEALAAIESIGALT